MLAAEDQQLVCQLACAFTGMENLIDFRARAARRLRLLVDERRVARDHGQQVVEVVRDDPGEASDRLDLLLLEQGRLQCRALLLVPCAFGPIANHGLQHDAARDLHGVDGDVDVDLGSVLAAAAPFDVLRHGGSPRLAAGGADDCLEALVIFGWPELEGGHLEELRLGVPVEVLSGGVDGEEPERLAVEHPRRLWVRLEQRAIRGLALEREGLRRGTDVCACHARRATTCQEPVSVRAAAFPRERVLAARRPRRGCHWTDRHWCRVRSRRAV